MRVLSLGAGVQSSTMLLMACEGLIDRPDCAIFADTGWEPRSVYYWLDELEVLAGQAGITIYRVSKGDLRQDILDAVETKPHLTANPPFFVVPFYATDEENNVSPLRRQCTKDYKMAPIRKKARQLYEAQHGRIENGCVEMLIGISTDEAIRMKPADVKWITHRWPLIEKLMSRNDCLQWLQSRGYAQPPKSACIGCPYHSDAMWAEMKEKEPNDFADACEVDRAIRHIPRVKGRVYLHRSGQPLEEVDFQLRLRLRRGDLEGQGMLFEEDGFGNECEGMCGV